MPLSPFPAQSPAAKAVVEQILGAAYPMEKRIKVLDIPEVLRNTINFQDRLTEFFSLCGVIHSISPSGVHTTVINKFKRDGAAAAALLDSHNLKFGVKSFKFNLLAMFPPVRGSDPGGMITTCSEGRSATQNHEATVAGGGARGQAPAVPPALPYHSPP
ncbi:hypothetical protein BDK51DRAFT_32903 [Blyttiomyces helicus]|uniref:Uncharacterized protein n=1 Tax=Blyttiomyces helicus TaxID=388810 RepID=A0A4P9W9K3_9FUNG|nr:hypothetical protein BDK51DRAFT_32903 [Blyttiomyces helicus]|eukprot:RKO89084.1 hypothetical protein BDK51DRAFT_32903 [Blyttiomyces helicus]